MSRNIVPARPSRQPTPQKRNFRRKLKPADATDAQVAVPGAVDLPLPKPLGQQIAVPASINGRDLSDGRP